MNIPQLRNKIMSKIQEYSMGLMFNDNMSQVLLIKKEHGPKCVVGRWNGIGGHVELPPLHRGETPIQCQVREFQEETGVETTEDDWAKFTKLVGPDAIVHCFYGISNFAVLNAWTMTDEKVQIWPTNPQQLADATFAPHLIWMILFLCDGSTKNYLDIVLATYCKDDNIDTNPIATI